MSFLKISIKFFCAVKIAFCKEYLPDITYGEEESRSVTHPKTVITPLKEEHFISNLINSYKVYAYKKIRRQKTATFRKEDEKEKTV